MNRYLTTSERVFLHMADQVVMNPVVMVRCRGRVPVERVEAAIHKATGRHPALGVKVVIGAMPWFSDRDVPSVPLRVVERESEEHWREIVRVELNDPMPIQRGPLIRFVLVRDEEAFELICTTDHVNADGRSGLFVLRDVLRAIDDPDLRLVPLRPRSCFDDYLPGTGSTAQDLAWNLAYGPRLPDPIRGVWVDRVHDALEIFAGGDAVGLARLRSRVFGLPEPPPVPSQPAPIEFVHRRLSADLTAALVSSCREHDNTVLSALVVACSEALITAGGANAGGLIGCITPIDVRAMLTPSVGDDFGIYAWAPTSYHPVGPGANFWALAKRVRRIMRTYRTVPALAGMRRLLDAMEFTEGTRLESVYDKVGRLILDGVMVVSNLGRVTLPERISNGDGDGGGGEIEVESFGFFAMIPNVDFVLGVQSFRGVLELNYCCSPNWMRAEQVAGVADRVEATLEAASGAPPRGTAARLNY